LGDQVVPVCQQTLGEATFRACGHLSMWCPFGVRQKSVKEAAKKQKRSRKAQQEEERKNGNSFFLAG